jgi:hypothetical protein
MNASGEMDRVRDYLVGRLSEEECRTFEDRLAHDPALAREFEQALELREGLKELQAQGYFANSAGQRAGRRAALRFGMWLPALAAAAVVGVVLFLWTERSVAPSGVLRPSPELTAGAGAAAVAAKFTFISVRGAATPDLDLPSAGLIEFRASPGMHTAASRYRMTLVRNDESGPSRALGMLTDLALGDDGYVHGYADAANLPPGSYVLRVDSGTAGAGASQEFAFTLRAGSGPPAE